MLSENDPETEAGFWSNNYEMNHGGDYWKGVTHDNAHCGNSSNQVIFDENYSEPRNVSTVQVGNTIYWTTRASDGRNWNHKGTVFATAEGHPNRS